MKVLDLQIGGHKRTNDDLIHLSDMILEVRDTLHQLLNKGYPIKVAAIEPSIVLTGCVVTDNVTDFDLTAGLIYHAGEVFEVDAVSAGAKVAADTLSWVVAETFIVGDPVTYFDSIPKNVHKIRKLVPTWDQIIIAGEVLDSHLRRPDAQWRIVGDPGEPAFLNGWVNYDILTHNAAQFRMDIDGVVHLRGVIKNGSSGSFWNMPTTHRPNRDQWIKLIDFGANSHLGVCLDTTGDVGLSGAIPGLGVVLDDSSYSADLQI